MPIRTYFDFTLILDDIRTSAGGAVEQFSVLVSDSPAGQAEAKDIVAVPDELSDLTYRLQSRGLDADRNGQGQLGRLLADLLLPAPAQQPNTRQLFHESLALLHEGEGLRVRLRAPAELAAYPWEFACVPRPGGGPPRFLLFDRQVSLVRNDALAVPVTPDRYLAPARRRVVYALASPRPYERYRRLTALPGERDAVRQALDGAPGVDAVYLPPGPAADGTLPGTTLGQLTDALGERTDVLHFSGHGEHRPGESGGGFLILADAANDAVPVSAARLGELLHGLGVRLVVLGACHTADGDARAPWAGVAAALLRAGVPAVVAMQYAVRDDLTAAFCGAFYRALVAGLQIDDAVTAGRLVMRAKALEQPASAEARDWASPVLFLRTASGWVFRPVGAPAAVAAAAELSDRVNQAVRAVVAGGELVGAVGPGNVQVRQEVGRAAGFVLGSLSVRREGGQIRVEQNIDEVSAGGRVIGAVLGTVRGDRTPGPAEALEKYLLTPPEQTPSKPKKKKRRREDEP